MIVLRSTFLATAAATALFVATPESASARKLPTRVFTVADGLPQNEINCLLEDSRGFLWIGTSDGLARFDGREFATYGVAEGLPHAGIHDMLEAPDGSLWLATGAGVSRFDVVKIASAASVFHTYRLAEDVGSNMVWRLHRDRKGRVWAGSAFGLFVLEPGREAFRTVPLDLPKPAVPMINASSFAEGPEGDLWVGTTWALVRILPNGRQVRYLPARPEHARGVRDLHLDGRGRLWISWDRGLTIYRPAPVRGGETQILVPAGTTRCVELPGLSPAQGDACEISHRDGLPDSVPTVHESASGQIRLLAESGLYSAEQGALRIDETASHFAPSKLRCLAADRHGSFWIGTESGGLVRIAFASAATWTTEDGLLSDRINSVFEGSDGNLYVTTTGGAIHRLDGDRFVGVMPALPPRITYRGWGWGQVVIKDRYGEWWYATGQGLARYPAVARLEDLARARPRIYTTRDGLTGDDIFRIFEDSRGDIWISSISPATPGVERLTRWERKTDSIRVCPPAFAANTASAFAEDRSGNVWVGFYGGGLARYRSGRFDLLPPGGTVPRGFVRQVFRDSKGRLWIATTEQGVARVDAPDAEHPSFRLYGRAQGLSSDQTYALTEDETGHLYIANSGGIDRLDLSTGRVRHYTAAEGLASTATVAAARGRGGRLWFGTVQGLFQLDARPEARAAPPPVSLRGLEIRGQRLPLPAAGIQTLRLPELRPDRNQIRVEFFSPSLAADEQIRFRYKLEGHGGDWSDPSSDDSVQYGGMSPGRYRLLVEAVTSDGIRSRKPASLAFRILPPLWQRWWFLSVAGIAAASLLLWIHRLRVARLLEVERVRSRIAADLHDDLGTSLYRISILSELAGRQVAEPGQDARPLLSDIGETARDLIESAGDMVWSVDPRHDDLASLAARVRHYASEMLEAQGVVWSLEGPPGAERILLGAETRRQLYLICKEAIRNALRHGRPRHVAMRLAAGDGRLEAEIRDDGQGFVQAAPFEGQGEPSGYGLATMRQRAEGLGGEFQIRSVQGEGTRILIRVPFRTAHDHALSRHTPDG